MSRLAPPDPWRALAAKTPARIALGRAGVSLPTRAVLDFALGHARARDAIHAPLDTSALCGAVGALGLRTVVVHSAAIDRATYLRRPDLGRRLDDDSARRLGVAQANGDVVVVVGDGLSSAAVRDHAAPLIAGLAGRLREQGRDLGPVIVAGQARVALGDEIGARLGARLVIVLIGERPGLSSPDSLGVYLTWDPRPGRTDAERNCVSNIRPQGLAIPIAADRIAWLAREAFRRSLTGVDLKDESVLDALATATSTSLASPEA